MNNDVSEIFEELMNEDVISPKFDEDDICIGCYYDGKFKDHIDKHKYWKIQDALKYVDNSRVYGQEWMNHLDYLKNLDIDKMQAGLRFLRFAASVKVEEVATCAGISRQYYMDIEAGKKKLHRPLAVALLYIFGKNLGIYNTRINEFDCNYGTIFYRATQKTDPTTVEQLHKLSEYAQKIWRYKNITEEKVYKDICIILNVKTTESSRNATIYMIGIFNFINRLEYDRCKENK